MLALGADAKLHKYDSLGNTPLHLAAFSGHKVNILKHQLCSHCMEWIEEQADFWELLRAPRRVLRTSTVNILKSQRYSQGMDSIE